MAELLSVAVITPIGDDSDIFTFIDTRQSVMSAIRKLSPLCDMRWVIQADGTEPPSFLSRQEEANCEVNGETLGAGVSRNMAMARTEADIIVAVNSGDQIVNLAPLIYALLDYPEIGWAAGTNLYLSCDSSLRAVGLPWYGESVKQRMVLDLWDETGVCPFPASGSIAYRRSSLEAVGGWNSGDTTGMRTLAEVTETFDGWVTDEIVHTFRETKKIGADFPLRSELLERRQESALQVS